MIRDILHRLEDRCPTHVIVWPVPVQGEGAAAKVAAAIRGFGALEAGGAVPRPDLLIVARGGGSIEDLWAFNEEEVVRAAAESPIPLISAVGHETDTTLIDHAADLRAPTPTAAAEMAVPVRAELFALLDELRPARRAHCLSRMAERARERFDLTVCRWPGREALFAPAAQRLDELGDRLPRALAARAGNARADLNAVAPRLRRELLLDRLKRSSEKLDRCGGWPSWRIPSGRLRAASCGSPTGRGDAGAGCRRDRRAAADAALRRRHGRGDRSAGRGGSAPPPVERKRRSAYVAPQPGLFDEAEE